MLMKDLFKNCLVDTNEGVRDFSETPFYTRDNNFFCFEPTTSVSWSIRISLKEKELCLRDNTNGNSVCYYYIGEKWIIDPLANGAFYLRCRYPDDCAHSTGTWCKNANTACTACGKWEFIYGLDECFDEAAYPKVDQLTSDNLKFGEFIERTTDGGWFWGKKFKDGTITGSNISEDFEVPPTCKMNDNFYFIGVKLC